MANTRWLFKGGRDPKDYLKVNYTTVTNPLDSTARLLVPENNEFEKLVVYTHGSGESQDSPLINPINLDLTLRMLAEGWCVLSHHAQGEAWGNLASINDYKNVITWAKTQGTFAEIVILSQSMGGLAGLRLLVDLPEIVKWYGIYPVCNLANVFGTAFKADIKTAYGFTNDADYATATAGYDPMLYTNSLFTGKRLMLISSFADTTVSRVQNSNSLVTKLSGVTEMTPLDGIGNHGNASHFVPQYVIDFFKS